MPAASLYLDECVDRGLVDVLRARGLLVTAARDEGMAGATDEEQLAYASLRERIIITRNAADFRRLHRLQLAHGGEHAGIIIIPQNTPFRVLELRAALMASWISTLTQVRAELFRWGQLQELLERGYRVPGYSDAEVRLVLGH